MKLPLSRRRELLADLPSASDDPLRLSPLLLAPSGEILEAVRKLGLEGIVGKRIDSIYEPGERSGAWIKLRTNLEQEFVIGGYIKSLILIGPDRFKDDTGAVIQIGRKHFQQARGPRTFPRLSKS